MEHDKVKIHLCGCLKVFSAWLKVSKLNSIMQVQGYKKLGEGTYKNTGGGGRGQELG